MDSPSFEILHFSVRYPNDPLDPPRYPYFTHNLVWRAIDPEFHSFCVDWTKDWVKTTVVFDTERAEEYIRGLSMEEDEQVVENQFGYAPVKLVQRDGIRRDTIYHDAWQMQFPFVFHLEKFDVFRHWGFTESNAITQACIHEIEMLKLGEHMYRGRFAPWCHFRRVIETLDRFWD
jgi:hypothetical protein